jgi:hypothetical protein
VQVAPWSAGIVGPGSMLSPNADVALYFSLGYNWWTDVWWTPVDQVAPTYIGLFESFRLTNDQAHGYLRDQFGHTALSFEPGWLAIAPIPLGDVSFRGLLEDGAYFLGHVQGQAPYIAAGFGVLGAFESLDDMSLSAGTFYEVNEVLDDGIHAAFTYELPGGSTWDTELARIEGGQIIEQRPIALGVSVFFWWEQRGNFVYAISPDPNPDPNYKYRVWGFDLSQDELAQPMSESYDYDGRDVLYSVAGNWFMYPNGEEWYLVQSISPGVETVVEWGDVQPGQYSHRAVPRLGG